MHAEPAEPKTSEQAETGAPEGHAPSETRRETASAEARARRPPAEYRATRDMMLGHRLRKTHVARSLRSTLWLDLSVSVAAMLLVAALAGLAGCVAVTCLLAGLCST